MHTYRSSVAALVLLILAGCGGKYDDFRKVIEDYNKTAEDFMEKVEGQTDAEILAPACETLSAELNALIPRIKKMNEKYPELKDTENWPDELSDLKEETKRVHLKFGEVLSEVGKQANRQQDDKEFQDAFRKVFKTMYEVGKL